MTKKMQFVTSFICLFFLAFQTATSRHFPSGGNIKAEMEKISAFLMFGDSTADPGNNNYIPTATRSNFLPYGRDFVTHKATGRFTNGRLVNDILAEQFGVKGYLPPYLDPSLTIDDLKTGVSFASAGSGYDQMTAKMSSVISLPTQLGYLKEYKLKLEAKIGKNETKKLIHDSLFITSAGTNDIVVNYFVVPARRLVSTLPEYMRFLVGETRDVVRAFVEEGGRRIGVVGLPPLGCVPLVITFFSDDAIHHRGCLDNISVVARDYNEMLREEVKSMQLEFGGDGVRIAYLDVYTPLNEMISGRKHGFEDVNYGCCGTGIVETSYLCNPSSPMCDDAGKYVFWDSFHPTDRAYSIIARGFSPVVESLFKK